VKTELKKIIHSEIEKALVKIWVNAELKGTGFFITPDGYLLTAYHCVKDYALGIKLETSTGDFKAKMYQPLEMVGLAVLKANYTPSHCVPIGKMSEKVQASDEIVVLDHSAHADSGKISRLKSNKIELSNSVEKSGAPIFHYATRRIIGLVLGKGQAISFTPLFAIWPDLEQTSDDVAKVWDERLKNMTQEQASEMEAEPQKDTGNKVINITQSRIDTIKM